MHHIEGIQQRRRDGYRPVHTPAALLEGFKDNGLVVEIDPAGAEGQGLRYPAPGIVQHTAQGPDGPVGARGGVQEGVTLGRRQIQASAVGVVQLDGVAHRRLRSGSSMTQENTMKQISAVLLPFPAKHVEHTL